MYEYTGLWLNVRRFERNSSQSPFLEMLQKLLVRLPSSEADVSPEPAQGNLGVSISNYCDETSLRKTKSYSYFWMCNDQTIFELRVHMPRAESESLSRERPKRIGDARCACVWTIHAVWIPFEVNSCIAGAGDRSD